jgi:two-component system, cell cycle sensor histidine kinase and response regulator CckA
MQRDDDGGERDRLLAAVVESAEDAIITETLDGTITSWNRAAEILFGYSAREAIGQSINIIVPAERRGEVSEIIATIGEGRRIRHLETVRRAKDGHLIEVSLSASPVRAPTGEIIGTAKITRELSEQRFAEPAFQFAIESSPGGVLVIDGSGKINLVNASIERLFGYGRTELLGQPVEILIPTELRDAHVKHRANFCANPVARPMGIGLDLVGQRKDGSKFPIEIELNPIRSRQAVIVMVTIHDITERLQLRQAQKMEAVGLLAGGVAHDFNNLLLVILVYVEMLRDECSAGDPRLQEVEEIIRAIERAQGLTRQLLAFSRRQPMQPAVVDLGDAVASVHSLLRRVLPSNIEIVTVVAEDVWPVFVDRGQLEQVVMNLAVNARDAMPEGGRFGIEVRNVGINHQDHGVSAGEYVELAFADTGSGIRVEELDRIFEPFYTTKGRGSGTGLGLATCYGIITQAGGHIAVRSELGRGTTFTVLLPRSRLTPETAAPAADVAHSEGRETILLVEDDRSAMHAAATALQRGGYSVVMAANGEEAFRLLQRRADEIDLVLSDVVMPRLGGPELAARISITWPKLPIVFMTGYSPDPILSQGGEKCIANRPVILKPFRGNDLLAFVREALDKMAR